MGQPKAVLFDFNGVLADDEDLHYSAMCSTLAEYGITLARSDYDSLCLGRSDQEAFPLLTRENYIRLRGVNKTNLLSTKSRYYQVLSRERNVVYPGAETILRELAQHFRLAIVSGSARSEVRAVLDHGQLQELFEVILTAEDVTRGKPDPQGYLHCAERLGVPPHSCVVVEDSPPGVTAACRADMPCIALLHTSSPAALSDATLVLRRLEHLSETNVQAAYLRHQQNTHLSQ